MWDGKGPPWRRVRVSSIGVGTGGGRGGVRWNVRQRREAQVEGQAEGGGPYEEEEKSGYKDGWGEEVE